MPKPNPIAPLPRAQIDVVRHALPEENERIKKAILALPQNTELLSLEEDTANDETWEVLGQHLTSVRDLQLETGWNEELNDEKLPLHWPLQRLVISSACGEVCKSPWIVEGKVPHLVLALTCGLRFEGPTSEELIAEHKAAVKRGEKEDHSKTESGITITFLEQLVHEYMVEKGEKSNEDDEKRKAEGKEEKQGQEKPETAMRTLEILENDAIDTLVRFTMQRTHVIENLHTLNIRSSRGLDMTSFDESMLQQLLPALENLRTLVLTIGDVFAERDYLPTLYKHLPPELETLRFRSSVALAKDPSASEAWKKAIADKEWLPNLKKLSFILDLPDKEADRKANEEATRRWVEKEAEKARLKEENGGVTPPEPESEGKESDAEESRKDAEEVAETVVTETKEEAEAKEAKEAEDAKTDPPQEIIADKKKNENYVPEEDLRVAKKMCEEVWAIAKERGIIVEPFVEKWSEDFILFHAVDYETWNRL